MASFNSHNEGGYKPSHVSNLTKTLQQSESQFIPTRDASSTFQNSYNEQLNFIPSGTNTPTHIASSYLSSYQNSYQSHSFRPPSIPNPIPTTSMETHDSLNARNRYPSSIPANWQPIENTHHGFDIPKHFPIPMKNDNSNNTIIDNSTTDKIHLSHYETPAHYYRNDGFNSFNSFGSLPTNIPSTNTPFYNPLPSNLNSSPDHYMSYQEFLTNLTAKDKLEHNDDVEHLNIVDYPVQDLIVKLSCLLTKIIEANDKLHPNHFDNTIAIRQKLKSERKLKLKKNSIVSTERKETPQQRDIDIECVEVDVDVDEEESNDNDNDGDLNNNNDDEDDDDEMKNKYLANVLAFHGTNVPGISLHAYFARVLKYCPVTNEVFLSLLVYFDRIAKKANNFKTRKSNDPNSPDTDQSEQLFVMDSFNIHRLIISGITVSSKFFSDIFYKNLRYAKVGGLPLEELNYLELQFLLLLDFKLMISVEDLQNYADLLLRFWKREQLTNEIINE